MRDKAACPESDGKFSRITSKGRLTVSAVMMMIIMRHNMALRTLYSMMSRIEVRIGVDWISVERYRKIDVL